MLTLDFQVATPRGNVRSQLSLFFVWRLLSRSTRYTVVCVCARACVCVDMYGPVKHNVM